MAKNPKDEQKNGASSVESAEPEAAAPASTKPAPKKRTKAAKTAGTKTAAAKATAKKAPAKSGAKKSAARKPAKSSGGYEPTDSEIRIRAYFIAEHRARAGSDGDPNNDWIEARQQLLDEDSQRSA